MSKLTVLDNVADTTSEDRTIQGGTVLVGCTGGSVDVILDGETVLQLAAAGGKDSFMRVHGYCNCVLTLTATAASTSVFIVEE